MRFLQFTAEPSVPGQHHLNIVLLDKKAENFGHTNLFI
jgi:hypothetical protein